MPDISRYLKKAKQMDAENGVVYTATPPTSANRSTYTPSQSGPDISSYLEKARAMDGGGYGTAPTVTADRRRISDVPGDYDVNIGKSGWQKYLADQERKRSEAMAAQKEKSFWEKLAGYLGEVQDTTMSLSGMPSIIEDYREDTSYLQPNDEWLDEERYIFGYLYDTDRTAAYQYADKVNAAINAEKEAAQAQKVTDSATNGFWGGAANTVGAILTAPLGLADYLDDLAQTSARGEIRDNGVMSPFEYSQNVTVGISQDLNEKYGTLNENIPVIGGKGWGDVYGLGTSIAQSALAGYTGGGGQALVQFFGSAAAASVDDALSRGATAEQAVIVGTASGVAEGLMENIGVENLLKIGSSATMRELVINLAKQGVIESLEEGGTSLLNNIADQLVMQDKSNFFILAKNYMDNGWSEEEAKRQAWLDMAEDIAYDMLGGFVSGAVHAGPQTVYHTISQNAQAKNTYGDSTHELVAEGLASAEGSLSRTLAEKYQAKLNSGGKLTGAEIHRLVIANEQQFYSEDMDAIKQAAENRLVELGEFEKASDVAAVLAKLAAKQKLTVAEKAIVQNSKYGQQVANEMNPSNIRSGGFESGWAKSIGTNTINYAEYNADLMSLAGDVAGVSTSSPVSASKESAPTAGSLTPAAVAPATERFTASESGKLTNKKTGADLGKVEITSSDGKSLKLKTESGEIVDAKDVDFRSKDEAMVYSAVLDMGVSPVVAQSIVDNFDGTDGRVYAADVNLAYRYGKMNFPKSLLEKLDIKPYQAEHAYNLGRSDAKAESVKPETTRKAKGKRGRVIFESAVDESTLTSVRRESLNGIKMLANLSSVEFHIFEGDKNNKFRFTKKDGSVISANGMYITGTNEIWIDLNAGNSGGGTMIYTAAHEISHYIRQWSPAKWQVMADFVLEQYGEHGNDATAHLQRQMDKIRKRPNAPTGNALMELAHEEMVCDALSEMLVDGNVAQKLSELKQKDRTLWDKIKDAIRNLLERWGVVRAEYAGRTPDAAEAQFLRGMDDAFSKLQDMYAEAFADADANFSAAEDLSTDTQPVETSVKHSFRSLAEAAGFGAMELEDGTKVFLRDRQRVSRVTLEDIENSPIGAMINFSVDMKDITTNDADRQKKMFRDFCNMAIKTGDFNMTMQFAGSAVFTGMKANADKQYGTTYDFPSICTKTQAVIDAMSARMVKLGRGLISDEIVEIYRKVFASGNPVPCPECYVFSRWIGIGGLLDNIKTYQDTYGKMSVDEAAAAYDKLHKQIEEIAKEKGLSFGKAKGKLASDLQKEYNKLKERIEKNQNQGEKVKPADAKRLADLEPMMTTVKALTWLENVYFADEKHTKINKNFRVPDNVLFDLNNGEAFATQYKEAWAFRTTQGAGYGKAITPYAEARLGEGILVTNNTANAIKGKANGTLKNYFLDQKGRMDDKAVAALKKARAKQKNQAFIGGQRFQSTSDARYENASDYLLAALEMQAMGGMVQVYTKVDGAVPAFSAWGFSINQSLMPLGGGLDANGNVKDTSTGGMNPDVAFRNREKHETAGTITIGVNDNHIRKMFAQWERDFIIPYHASGGKATIVAEFRDIQEKREAKGAKVRSTDYSRTQSDKVLSDEVLRWMGRTEDEIRQIHAVRDARIAILTGKSPNMDVVRGNRFLSNLYDKLRTKDGEWYGVVLAKGKVEGQIFPNEFWDQSVSYEDSAKITEDYLAYCKDLGILHRFSGMVPQNGILRPVTGYNERGERVQLTDLAYKYKDGEKTAEVEPFFWKVLTDRRMYDNSKKYLPQKRVTLNDTTTDTVATFATGNYGRQYNKELSQETAAKLADAKLSTRDADGEEVLYSDRDQEYDSKDTSVKILPATFTKFGLKPTDRVLDWGGGQYDIAKKAVEHGYPGIKFEVVDAFNRSETHNDRILAEYKADPATVLTINNVLNVIKETEIIEDVIRESKEYLAADGVCYIKIYEGNDVDGKTGNGKVTSSGWQNNQPAEWYRQFAEKYYQHVERVGDILIASDKPIDRKSLPKVDKDVAGAMRGKVKEIAKSEASMRESLYSDRDTEATVDLDARTRYEIVNGIEKGININDSKQDFTSQILSGAKTVETRKARWSRNQGKYIGSLDSLIGKRVALVRTGKGKATIVGYATVGTPTVYKNRAEFDKAYKKHLVSSESDYYIDGVKLGYPLTDVVAAETQRQIYSNDGRAFRSIMYSERDTDSVSHRDLLAELKKAGVKTKESGKLKMAERDDLTYAEITEKQRDLYQREMNLAERKREANSNPELLQAMDAFHGLSDEMRELLPKRRQGTATQEDLDRIEEIKVLRDVKLQQVVEIQERLGLKAMEAEDAEIRQMKEDLRVAADAAWKREGAERESAAIAKAGVSAPEYFRKKALKSFKTTTNFNEAGYLLPDGKLLNFSGGERNHRYRDHREIGEIYEATQGTAALNRFMSDGNIRIMAESPGVDITSGVEPTKEQYAAIRRFVNANGVKSGKFFVDFSDEEGHRAGNYFYEGRVSADRVINDIKHFYATGEIRAQSVVAQFRYSDRDFPDNAESVAKEHFGTTNKWAETGWLLQDGTQLDFSGRHWERDPDNEIDLGEGFYSGHRNVEHYEIAEAFPELRELSKMEYRGEHLDKFLKRGNIRVVGDGMLDIETMPTEAQIDKLRGYFRENIDKYIVIGIGAGGLEFREGTKPATIIEAIRDYFSNNRGSQSELMQFHTRFSDRDIDSVSNRDILANAFMDVAQNDVERGKIAEYQQEIKALDEYERKLRDIRAQLHDLSFSAGPRDNAKIRELREKATKLANRIGIQDKQLLRLEASKPLMAVLEREKKLAYSRASQKWEDRIETARTGRSKTEMRHKIKKIVGELNNLLLHGTKDKHIMIGLQKATAEALSAINMDTVAAEERLAKIQAKIDKATDPAEKARLQQSYARVEAMGDNMATRLTALKNAYEEIKDSGDPLVANAYQPEIEERIKNLRKMVGDTPLRNMSMEQLEFTYDTYKMVLTTIRNANKAFKNERSESIAVLGNRSMEEIGRVGGKKEIVASAMRGPLGFAWSGMKPTYAFKAIGSDTLSELFSQVRAGEDVWATDVNEAKEFYSQKTKQYNYDSWDLEKEYTFTSKSGKEFKLTLEQIMSLYAYSKRKQADAHLDKGGFVYDSSIEVVKRSKLGIPVKYRVNTAHAHALSRDTLMEICKTLTDEQVKFVDEMQDYLSTVMGEKGNEVSLKMYGVKLFKEKFYFPLKSAKQFMYEQYEVAGDRKIKNSGFSKDTTPHASNPVILNNFTDVWATHVNDMAMYHAFVLPMEDFERVFNYKTPTSDTMPTESVKGYLQDAYGAHPEQYIKQLMTDLNGGARIDPTAGIINKGIALFKKSAVFASLSVVIQQPSAIARAMAYIDAKYFVGKPGLKDWDEVKKYAPVAIIKEMGYFDTNMGKSTVEFIKAKEYTGVKSKMKALVTDRQYRDEILSKAPSVADELAWCQIWNAVKKEIAETKKLQGEELLQAAGKRFTEVIVNTQVYDSVLTRSGMMRSKDTGMKMATSFMAEPTTSLNMIADALIQGKRGNKSYARKAIGAVAASMILNSILVSFVYAGRDDDEDKTYIEKYAGSLTSELIDSFNPLTLIPFVKDIVSIAQGYDVERSDMAVITDLFNAWKKLSSDNLSVYRKVEGFGGAIASVFGLPLKNIMRDVRGIYNTVKSAVAGPDTTGRGMLDAAKESLPKWMGGGERSNADQLYAAMLSGDTGHVERLKARFKDDRAFTYAVRDGLVNNDKRITAAAEARAAGNQTEYMRLAREIVNEGHFSQDDVVRAVNYVLNSLTKKESEPAEATKPDTFKIDEYLSEALSGDQAEAELVKREIIAGHVADGKTEDEALKSFNNSFKNTAVKGAFTDGDITMDVAISMLQQYGGVEPDDAYADVQYWQFKQNHPDIYVVDSWFDSYYEYASDAGIGIDVYMQYRNDVKNITGENKKERRMAAINALPLSPAQKDALYFDEGWVASKLYEAPWR